MYTTYMDTHIYIYIYIERERERGRQSTHINYQEGRRKHIFPKPLCERSEPAPPRCSRGRSP